MTHPLILKGCVGININISKNYGYPDFSSVSSGILEQRFSLSKSDLEFINSIKEKKNRLGFAVLFKTFGYLGYFINDVRKVPNKIVLYLSQQLDLDVKSINRYNKLESVKGYHIRLIKKYYGVNIFDSESKEAIFKWLVEQCRITSDYINIVKSCVQKIKIDHFELPSVNYRRQTSIYIFCFRREINIRKLLNAEFFKVLYNIFADDKKVGRQEVFLMA